METEILQIKTKETRIIFNILKINQYINYKVQIICYRFNLIESSFRGAALLTVEDRAAKGG